MRAVGVDGCRGGWLAVEAGGGAAIFSHLAEVAAAFPGAMVVIDTPVGLPETWSDRRATDDAARMFLKDRNVERHKNVHTRVFNAPQRPALEMFRAGADHAAISREAPPKDGVSIQAFHILRCIDEADRLIAPATQDRLCESHPEIAFAHAAGETLGPKKRAEGRATRRVLLATLGFDPDALAVTLGPKTGRWATDDLLDACILANVARRRIAGEAIRLPEEPARDGRGLRMEIWA